MKIALKAREFFLGLHVDPKKPLDLRVSSNKGGVLAHISTDGLVPELLSHTQ